MAIESAGKLLLQTQASSIISKARLKLEYYTNLSLEETGFSSAQSIAFGSPNASAGLQISGSLVFSVSFSSPYTAVNIVGVQLTNSDASVVYYDKDFSAPFTLIENGEFTLSTVTLNFGSSGDGSSTVSAETSFAGTLDSGFAKARLKGRANISIGQNDTIYTPLVSIASGDITYSGGTLTQQNSLVFSITFNSFYNYFEYDEIEFYASNGTTLYLTAPLDDTYTYNADGTFTLTGFTLTLS